MTAIASNLVTEPQHAAQVALPSCPASALVRVVLLESLLLGIFGAAAGAVMGLMTAGVLSSANIHVPLSVQLFLMSDTFQLSVLPSALGGAIALISVVTGLSALCPEDNQLA